MLKRADFVGSNENPRHVKTALKLAKFYKAMLKGSVSVYSNPFKKGVPLELQSVFVHFMKTAEIVIEDKADPELYIRAQFEGLKKYKSSAFPFPPQLHSTNARLRYMEYAHLKEVAKDREVTEEDYQLDDYELQQLKLDRMCAGHGLSEKKCLLLFGKQFTKQFLRSKGVRP